MCSTKSGFQERSAQVRQTRRTSMCGSRCLPATVAILGFLLAGCGRDDVVEVAVVHQPIFYGTLDETPTHSAAVALAIGPTPQVFCSGTLVAPGVVVTAAHCLKAVQPFTNIVVFFGTDVESGGEVRLVSGGMMHPNFGDWGLDNDIGVLRLRTTAPLDVLPIPRLPEDLSLSQEDQGSEIDLCGFGFTEYSGAGVKHHVAAILAEVCDIQQGCDMGGAGLNLNTFGYWMDPGGACEGDSGGPVFMMRGATEYLVGVHSYGDGCSTFGANTTVDRYAGWIDGFIAQGASENCCSGEDEDGDGATDCDDPDCVRYPSCLGENACQEATTLSCGEQTEGDTSGGPHNFLSYSCLAGYRCLGPERAYRLVIPEGVEVETSLTHGEGTRLDLFLVGGTLDSCEPGECSKYASGWSSPKVIEFTKSAGETYLVVDSLLEDPSTFQLTVSCKGPAENCTNGSDDDGNGDIDCEDSACLTHDSCQPCTDEDCVSEGDVLDVLSDMEPGEDSSAEVLDEDPDRASVELPPDSQPDQVAEPSPEADKADLLKAASSGGCSQIPLQRCHSDPGLAVLLLLLVLGAVIRRARSSATLPLTPTPCAR